MAGEISFGESLHRRVQLLSANREHINRLAEFLQTQVNSLQWDNCIAKPNQKYLHVVDSYSNHDSRVPFTKRP